LIVIAAVVVIGVAGGLFVSAGGVDVSADKTDGPLVSFLLHYTFKRSEAAKASEVTAPGDLASPYRVRLGAQHFDMVCANCHGRPGFGQSVTALSMNPRPQYLPKVIGQFTDRELYTIVEHGVKYSAMPSWPTDARGDEVWSMVAFLKRLPGMDGATYRALTAPPQSGAPTTAGMVGDSILRPASPLRPTEFRDEFLFAAPAAGFEAASIHDNPTATCARCHGVDGSGAATGGEAPNLTIQDAAYLQRALEAYTRGSRKSGFMQTIAAELSGPQISALARYYAGLPVQTVSSPPADPALVARGERIALGGLRDRAIPACASCHESSGARITGAPHIAGQSATYLRRQLAAMAHGGRGSSFMWNPMPAVAHDLSVGEVAAVAAYYSGLKPAKASGGGQVVQASQPSIDWGSAEPRMREAKAIFIDQCEKCHVNQGRGDLEGNYPDLTIQTTPYVAQTLYEFRAQTRPNVKMREIVDSLNLDQLESLAHYVNSLAPRPAPARANAAAAQRGAVIAVHGAPARGVPACLSCHGASGIAALPLIPHLQGQNSAYLHNRLDRFAQPNSNISALNPMPQISRRLTEGERADLAAYFADAPPLQKAASRP
jgi:cytochrome c553